MVSDDFRPMPSLTIATNELVGISQARRFYPLFSQISSIGSVLAGQVALRLAAAGVSFAYELQIAQPLAQPAVATPGVGVARRTSRPPSASSSRPPSGLTGDGRVRWPSVAASASSCELPWLW